jgi:hypothetical protein
MKCSASPTICIAAERAPQPAAVRTLEAVLFAKVLEPLAEPLGPAGELALTTVAQRVFPPETR